MRAVIVVPTYNGGELWERCCNHISRQNFKPECVLTIDSSSTDHTSEISSKHSFEVISIPSESFNHGGTRNLAAKSVGYSDCMIFLTQDALLEGEDAIGNLISFFDDASVSAVCGRQLPHYQANPLATHARLFNYEDTSKVKSKADISSLGIRTAFMSNSFCAYRTKTFWELGGFPDNTILAEDMYLAAKMIQAGYRVAYCSEAAVRHSHNYSPWEEFRRYFDTGVFHACEPWIQQQLGGASGEGARFVKSELLYLWRHAPLWIPRALMTTACKLIGYKLGQHYRKIPKAWWPKFSMYKSYWLQQDK